MEFAGDQLCKRLAMEIQRDLDDYIQVNPEFPVSTWWCKCGYIWKLR
jgi:hypothetical protein